MLDSFIFENHLGQRFDGLKNGVFLNYSDLRDYSWSYDTLNNQISRFYMGVTDRKIPLVVYCSSDEDAVNIKNRLHELAEADIVATLPGKIRIGDWYTNGYITASKKGEYLVNKRYCTLELTLTSNDPAWFCETKHSFSPENAGSVEAENGTDYPYDYAYDYAVALRGRRVQCNSVRDSAFKLLIYGPATDPSVMIGENTYTIKGSVAAGETLLVNSLDKTITLTTSTGKTANWFDHRGRDSYIFEPIRPGQNVVSWGGAFGFDLTVVEKRSEPKWT